MIQCLVSRRGSYPLLSSTAMSSFPRMSLPDVHLPGRHEAAEAHSVCNNTTTPYSYLGCRQPSPFWSQTRTCWFAPLQPDHDGCETISTRPYCRFQSSCTLRKKSSCQCPPEGRHPLTKLSTSVETRSRVMPDGVHNHLLGGRSESWMPVMEDRGPHPHPILLRCATGEGTRVLLLHRTPQITPIHP